MEGGKPGREGRRDGEREVGEGGRPRCMSVHSSTVHPHTQIGTIQSLTRTLSDPTSEKTDTYRYGQDRFWHGVSPFAQPYRTHSHRTQLQSKTYRSQYDTVHCVALRS